MTQTQIKHRFGEIGPTSGTGVEGVQRIQPQKLLPDDVVQVSAGIGITDYTPEGVDEAVRERYWPCVETLVAGGAQSINQGGVPISSQLGRPRMLKLMEETTAKTGLPASSTNEAIIEVLKQRGIGEIAVASRWAPQLNQALTDYYAHAGIKVVYITSEGQWAKEAFAMSIEKGIVLAVRLGREAMKKAPNAGALLLPGGTWRSLAAVPLLEEDFDVPVLTNRIAIVWRLIKGGYAPPVQGWGRVLANP